MGTQTERPFNHKNQSPYELANALSFASVQPEDLLHI
jgi:hypothetical protein